MNVEGKEVRYSSNRTTSSFRILHSIVDVLYVKVVNARAGSQPPIASISPHAAPLPYFQQSAEAAPLAVFRILFGVMMFASIVRFWSYGWIDQLYVQPRFFFSYYGFDFIRPLGQFTYLIFGICALSALFVTLGYYYRTAIVVFFLSFTYIELMDKTTYLNHYYFISVLSFLMIWLPASAYFSVDARRNPERAFQRIPRWTIDAIKLLLGIVYCYAGLAKLNSDWLLHAMPLKIWLPANYDLPLLGNLLQQTWVHYAFSGGGMLYDLSIPFLLLWPRTRTVAFGLVVVFHILTRVLFPIGMFPYIMIVSALIFFDARFHHRLLAWAARWLRIDKAAFDNGKNLYAQGVPVNPSLFTSKFIIPYSMFDISTYRTPSKGRPMMKLGIVVTFFVLQLLLPFRYLLYPGELFWTEEGYRFSWRVMLMEKAGYANFKVVDAATGQRFYVDNSDFLTTFQEKQLATQPDFILQYAHFLADHFTQQGHQPVQVFAESYVALNGRMSQAYVDPNVDLAQVEESFRPRTWLLPFDDEIKGL